MVAGGAGVGARIKKRRAVVGLRSQESLSVKVGVSRVTVTDWENDKVMPSGEHLLKLAGALRCSPEWLMTGRGGDKAGPGDFFSVAPVIGWDAIAAALRGDPVGGGRVAPRPHGSGGRCFALEVESDAMVGSGGDGYPPGSVIVVDPDLRPSIGARVIARMPGGEFTFRELVRDSGRLYLKPLNSLYTIAEVAELGCVVGVVVWSFVVE